MKDKLSRRNFLKTSGAAAGAAFAFNIVPSSVFGADAPSNKLNIAGIGIGGMGFGNLNGCAGENIVALCDVDSGGHTAGARKKFPKAKVFKDFRVMFDKMDKDIDAVIVATPDHTHAVITMEAMRRGKHVYCQKPLTHTVFESRKIAEAAKTFGVVTQMGNQGHSSNNTRKLKEWLEDGAIGDVKQVYGWTDRPVGGQVYSDFAVKARSKDTPPIPDTLNWDLWLGPVAHRPYHPDYVPTKWRAWQDFGTGPLGDMGCHILDPSFWALDLGAPESVQATTSHWEKDVMNETFPRASIVRFKFPARGKRPPVKLTWSDGRLLPPVPEFFESGRKFTRSGALLIGEKGGIMHGSHGAGGMRIVPEVQHREYKKPAEKYPRVGTWHVKDWLRACKGGRACCSPFEYGAALTEMALLGMCAIRMPNKLLKWDTKALKFTNNEKANELLHIDYRKGWKL
ncbi:MAG: Gfo/Idh/MocA family oxidoreductase [Planctomycetes bacterium]|nr:Gfo/Idh/MocA family oxidoreductase [Planctomycetota bacterium]